MKNEFLLEFQTFKKFLLLFILINIFYCSNDEFDRNPYLYEISFSHSINLNLPEYDNLNFAGGSKFIPYGGINGLLVFNINGNDIFAWEASCPNHELKPCSQLSIEGLLAVCQCNNNKYSLATGQLLMEKTGNSSQYPLLNYRVERSANTVIISN